MRETAAAYQKRLQWFREARFGMFIHWGLFSLVGRGTWAMLADRIPPREFAKLADQFVAKKFDADAWAGLAAEAGMKYMVLTSRHHDGFCLWDSQVSDFTSVKTAAKRDFVAEYVEACRRAGLRVGFYYSLCDWRFPGYFERRKYKRSADALVQQCHDQIRELLSNYGKIDILWFDGHWFLDHLAWIHEKPEAMAVFWRTKELVATMRKLQPHIIMNNRTGLPGDFDSLERYLEDRWSKEDRFWELCQCMGDYWESWCYMRYTPRPSRQSISSLVNQLVVCAAQGGNFLLNVGPSHTGVIPPGEVQRLRGIGKWLKVNGDAIFGTKPGSANSCSTMTVKGNVGYIMLPCWPGHEVIYPNIKPKAVKAEFMLTKKRLKISYDENKRLIISGLPKEPPDPHVTVIKVTFDGPFGMRQEPDKAWMKHVSIVKGK